MKGEKTVCVLGTDDKVKVNFLNGKAGIYLLISGNGDVSIYGSNIDSSIGDGSLVEYVPAVDRSFNIFSDPDGVQGLATMVSTVQPTKLEKIERYVDLLCRAQHSEQDVDAELGEALKLYKQEAGI